MPRGSAATRRRRACSTPPEPGARSSGRRGPRSAAAAPRRATRRGRRSRATRAARRARAAGAARSRGGREGGAFLSPYVPSLRFHTMASIVHALAEWDGWALQESHALRWEPLTALFVVASAWWVKWPL